MSESIDKQPVSDNGIKLPYFHRKLSDEDSQLIGDTTPKRIDQSNEQDKNNNALSKSSAWNSASTWEERDCSSWAKDTLKQALIDKDVVLTKDNITMIIDDIKDITGNAQITHSRGKVRYLYEFSLNIQVNITNTTNDEELCSGTTIKVDDIINDLLDDIEISIEWGSNKPTNTYSNTIKALTNKEFKDYIIKVLKKFEDEFRKI